MQRTGGFATIILPVFMVIALSLGLPLPVYLAKNSAYAFVASFLAKNSAYASVASFSGEKL
ncbi:hypothetical protein [Paenibacillus piri]|uniref:Uncharacterized protein n=1 Tax=Paenibacillus piri TaxID=2547395 RepID=A0A4R5KL39_9BACL|nr:hypothetical protein [Paenibacillus piri]TDF95558.1 hypothetical protein E1757_20930 [Paenibacillus piri]